MHKSQPAKEIDTIIALHEDWRGQLLAELRTTILATNPDIAEEIKWRKPSRPEGVPVWTYNGNVCVGDILKNAVRITFFKGAFLTDSSHLFNARLDSKTVRAIDYSKGQAVDAAALTDLIRQAMEQN